MSGVEREDVLERLRALDFEGRYDEVWHQSIADDILALFAVPMEAVAWRFKFASSPSWSYRDGPPDADWADQCRDVQALAVIPALGNKEEKQ